MRSNNFTKMINPSVVLVVICLVVSLALAYTYGATAPVIEKNAIEMANKTRGEILPSGETYTLYDGKLIEGVKDCYIADNGAGITVTSTAKSFGGLVTVMVGIDADGAIVGIAVTDHADTPGLGTKAHLPEYLKQYVGVTDIDKDIATIKKDPKLDGVTGATVSSNGVYNAARGALAQFELCGGVL